MVAYAELEIKEKELKQALELADSLDERKALRLELREVRKLLFDTPKNSANDISKTSSKPSTTSTIIQTKKQTTTDFNNNNNDMTLTSQDSYDAPSVSKTAAERAARRTRRAQHMKNMVNDTSAITTVINATSQDKKPEEKHVEENMGQLKTETKNENSVGSVQKVSTELSTKPTFHVRDNTKSQTQNTPTFSVRDNTGGNVQSKPTFNANSSPGLRRTATWSPKDRVASKNATNNNAFSSNKAKFGSQAGESPFSFGISFVKDKNIEGEAKNNNDSGLNRTFSVNKYTPTKTPVSYKNNAHSEVHRSSTFTPSSTFMKTQFHSANESRLISPNSHESNYKDSGLNTGPHFHSASEVRYNSVDSVNTNSNVSTWSPAPSFNKYKTSITTTHNHTSVENNKNENVDDLGLNFMRSKDMFAKMENDQLDNTRPKSAFGYGQKNVTKTLSLEPNKQQSVNKFTLRNTLSLSASLKTDMSNQETSVNNNRLSLQDRTPNRFQNSRDKSPSRFEQNRDKSPSRFEANRNRPGNSLSIREKSPTPFGDRTQPERPKSHIGVAGMKGISGSAANRMSMFKEAEEKQAREIELKKKRDEDRKKNAEVIAAKAAEDAKKRAEEEARKKAEDERKKKEEEERKKKEAEEEAKKAIESNKEEMKDSEKMKYAAPCMRKREKKKVVRRTMSISSIVLDWVQEMIKDYPVEVTNFSSSWNNGMAFCALIHKFNPDEFDFNELKPENKRHNFDLAFNTGLKCKNIPILLDTEDMVRMKKPEPRSVQCYIQWIWSVYGPTSGYGPTPQEIQTASLS